ncbi:D-alanyl-D-alanine carboxypeptidase [Variovorax sp. RO1]|uniref:M15 family metallopeptidase n=1 Tax=Variovorax sp. RO1 TaxID=2066034 RepID=UPI000C7185EB|nr:D-alanyl-D-alanine carboxypeptidase [Variovorax sp. RO1]
MIFFTLFCYFALMVAALAIFLFPSFRDRVLRATVAVFTAIAFFFIGIGHRLGFVSEASFQLMRDSGSGVRTFAVRHRYLLLSGMGLLIVPVLLSVTFGSGRVLFFDDWAATSDPKIEALLQGEQLVPPQPLPPEVFATAEVEQIRPLTKEGSRDWAALDVDFRNRLLLVYKIMKEKHGYDLALLEGYRSPERQAKLAALGNTVTMAKANQSYHQYGLAADNAFYRNGKLVISEKDPWAMEGYRLYGEAAESVGLVWGGRWSFRDYGHVEYRKPGFKLSRN